MAIKPSRTVTVGGKPYVDRDELKERLAAQGYHATMMLARSSDPVASATWEGYIQGINAALTIAGVTDV